MLKKDLLLGYLSEVPYTHILTVGDGGSTNAWYGFCDESFPGRWGNITPKEFIQGDSSIGNITMFMNQHSASTTYTLQFSVRRKFTNTRIYFGRSDTKENFGLCDTLTYDQVYWIKSGMFFSKDDVGKDIPIWLSYTPPPWL